MYWDNATSNLLSPFSLFELISDDKNTKGLFYNIALLYKGEKQTLASKDNSSEELFSMTWQDIQSKLSAQDIAIEFIKITPTVDYINIERTEPYYIALCLTKNCLEPIVYYLCLESELTVINEKNKYSSSQIYELIWSPLHALLENKKNIYFSPMGELNNIAIEYVKTAENSVGTMNDQYEIFRISSTRQIITGIKKEEIKSATIYGGIVYDGSIDSMKKESKKYSMRNAALSSARGLNLVDISLSLKDRSGITYLEGSKNEALAVYKHLSDNNYKANLMVGMEATEESFKALSGEAPFIVHIATHGFYWNEDEATEIATSNKRLLFMTQLNNENPKYMEDKAMTRSGLFMAGAKNTLNGTELPEEVDDGILTAQEIANLDLRGLNIVVLSACQTGLGDISGDGVYGLQRGFKIAGVQSILMSLWEVDDEATQILMTNFYRNYLGGMSKQQALREAQKTVRETPGFSDPEYWAAFILLDALN